jgi:hypothetical protein
VQDVEDQVTQEMDTVDTAGGSLAARMKRRGKELESQRTEVFEIPGWEEILAVELRVLGYEESRKIGRRLSKLRNESLQELYSYADQIVAATEGFYEVDGDRRTPVDKTWMDLARAASPNKLPEDLTPRMAVISLVGDRRVAYLFSDYEEWMRGERQGVDEEVVRDFGTTG